MKTQLLLLALIFIECCAPHYIQLSNEEIQENLRKRDLIRTENYLKKEKANENLKFVEGIDTVFISLIEGELKAMSEIFEIRPDFIKYVHKINFVKNNILKLDTTTQEIIMKYLFDKKINVHFLDTSDVNRDIFDGMGLYTFQADIDKEGAFTGVYINSYVAPLAARGYYCKLKKTGNKYTIISWDLMWVS